MLSILLSPCHLASIPLIVGYIDDLNGQGRVSTFRAFRISLLFSSGILLTIAALGVLTSAAGQLMGDVGIWANIFVAIVFIFVGLHLLGVLPSPWQRTGPITKRKGMLAAFLLGLIFGIALGPCTFAYMAPVLALSSFKLSAANMSFGILLLVLYGIGHCGVIVLAGTFTGAVQRYMNWNERSGATNLLRKACGVFVILGAFYILYIA